MTDSIQLFLQSTIPEMMPTLIAKVSRSSGNSALNLGSLVFQLLIYAVIAYCTQTFLKKLEYEKAWLAWVPLASTYALLEAGEQEQPLLWTILACIPIVGLISLIKLIPAYINICNRLGKSPAILWTFLLCGLGGLIVPIILAFT